MAGLINHDEDNTPFSEINTTPLVDVMLVLLVIFLVTAPMLTQAIKLELPNETATTIEDKSPLTITIDKDGNYFLDNDPISETDLGKIFKTTATSNKLRPVHIRADVNSSYGKLSKVISLSHKFGLNNIGFITEPK